MREEQLLKELREKLAKEKSRGGYCIFRDEEIEELLKNRPMSIKELEGLRGFPKGGKRVTNYGEAIVSIFANPNEVENIEIEYDEDGEPMVVAEIKRMVLFG